MVSFVVIQCSNLKAFVCNFYQNLNIHTLRCDFLCIHDDTHDNISKGEKSCSKHLYS